jgi:hypothetical protein
MSMSMVNTRLAWLAYDTFDASLVSTLSRITTAVGA